MKRILDKSNNHRILVVEDDLVISDMIAEGLSNSEYRIKCAENARDAIQLIKIFKPHLIIMDNEMPGQSGLELLKDIRHQKIYMAVIFISGTTDNKFIISAFNEGADDFIKKPFRINELVVRVEARLRYIDLHKELIEANEKLKDLVDNDYLTGLFNMRSMYEKIDFEIKRSIRFNRRVACVMLDMDNFKHVNDNNDHLYGSFVLKEVGHIIANQIRITDFAARYGGDEFLIVLTEPTKEGVSVFCERIRKKIFNYLFNDGRNSSRQTVSLGFSLSQPGQDNVDARTLVREADHALYDAKEKGRNCFVGYNN